MKQTFMILVTLLTLILHLSFLSVAPALRFSLHLPLLVLITWSLIDSLQTSLGFAIITGFVLDLYSETAFGLMTLSIVIAVALAWFLFQHVITNRSLYGYLALVLSATVVYWLFFWGSTSLLYLLRLDTFSWRLLPHSLFTNFIFVLLVHGIVTLLAYVIFGTLLKSFRRNFLPITKSKS